MLDLSKGLNKMALQNYETVAQRLERFWTDHPSGRVETKLIESGAGYWVFIAWIYAKAGDAHPIANGHAHETIGASQINKTSALEVCETSAVGRALALAGYHGSQIASAEEITRAKHRQEETPPAPRPIIPPVVTPAKTGSITRIGSKQYMKLIADAETVTDLMKAAQEIANDPELTEDQKNLLRGNWTNRRSQIELGSKV